MTSAWGGSMVSTTTISSPSCPPSRRRTTSRKRPQFRRDPAIGGYNADALGQGHTRRGEHLVGPQQDGLGDRQAQIPGDLEVNRQLELRGPLHGKIARPGTLQDLVNEDGCPGPQGGRVHPIGHEVGWPPEGPNRRQPLLDYKVPNPFGVQTEPRRVRNHEGLSLPVCYRAQGVLDVVGSAHLYRVQFQPQFPGGALQRFEPFLVFWENSHPRDAWQRPP